MSPSLQLAAARSITTISVGTPLLVPSFSSRGMPNLNGVLEAVRSTLPPACLVSAFDLAQGLLTGPLGEVADVVFVDSGLFEVRAAGGDLDLPWVPPATASWTRADYHQRVGRLTADTNLVLVNFDMPAPLAAQAAAAREDFAVVPQAAHDFLVKPESTTTLYVPVETLAGQAELLDACALLGVTEGELGPSLLERCRALVRLRSALSTNERNVPIHVFGCLRPLSCLAYFLCGADVFDGLAWIRYDLTGGTTHHAAESVLQEQRWATDDVRLRVDLWQRNLAFLERLAHAMGQYCHTRDAAVFRPLLPHTDQALALARAAGADV